MKLPAEMTLLSQWVVYRLESARGGRKTKIPYRATGVGKASSTDPATWTDYETALRNSKRFDGIGFVFTPNDPYIGIDLDKCINVEKGELAEWAQEIVNALNSYTELSPSGTGLHIIVKGILPGGGRREAGVEMYSESRFFTMTGQHYAGTPPEICDRANEVSELYIRLFGKPKPIHPKPDLPKNFLLDDAELLGKARKARNGCNFVALYDRGDASPYSGDESRADLALAGLLLFWTGGDCDRAERLFNDSALGQREKWRDRLDYRKRTLDRALQDMTSFYDPSASQPQQSKREAQRRNETLTASGQAKNASAPETPRTNKTQKENARSHASTVFSQNLQAEIPHILNQECAEFHLTDIGNAERLVRRFGHNLLYCAVWGKWLIWDEKRWQIDEMGGIMEYAKKTARCIYAEAATFPPGAENDPTAHVVSWAKKSENKERLNAMIALAQSDPAVAVHPDNFDTDPLLFCVENGTINLQTGELQPHCREDLITRISHVPYDQKAICPTFNAFLEKVLPDAEVCDFVRRATGYTLTGMTVEQCLFFSLRHGEERKIGVHWRYRMSSW